MPDNLVFEAGGWIEVDDGTGTVRLQAVSFTDKDCKAVVSVSCTAENGLNYEIQCMSCGCAADCELQDVAVPGGQVMKTCVCTG
jgi:hypothetical protein